MTATNHALTGALIGISVGHPVALVLAFVSHFVLDALPHYGTGLPPEILYKTKAFRNYLFAEAALCFGVVLLLFFARPEFWLLAVFCAFVAAAPDLLSINHFRITRGGKVWKPNLYSRFASGIQWFERPVGAVVEITWLAAVGFTLVKLI
jgi:hypothetical protein